MASTTWASASCRRRCWSGTWRRRRRSAGWRSGVPLPSPASHVVVLPADLTQEDHVDGLPFGTRGGAIVQLHVSARRASTRSRFGCLATATRTSKGSTEPHQVEISTLDGKRGQLFTVKPNRNQTGAYYADEAVDKDLKIRMPVQRGSARRRRDVPAKDIRARPETERQPYLAHFNMDRHPRIQPARLFGVDHRTVRRRRRRRHAEPPPDLRVPSGAARSRRRGLRQADRRRRLRGARIAAPVTDADLEAPLRFYKEARATGGFETGIEMAVRADSRQHRVPVPHRAGSARTPRRSTAYRVSDVELASRLSFFLWSSIPDEELLDLADSAGDCSQPAMLERQVKRMLADPRSEALVTNFAEPVAVSAQPRRGEPGRAAVPRLRRQPASGVSTRDRAVLREHRQRRPQRTRPAPGGLHLRERAAGQALRHPERVRQPIPSRLPRREQRARRTARPGQHPDRDVVRQSHVAGASRQVDPREHPRYAAATTAAERAAAAGDRRGRPARSRCASAWCSTGRIRRAPAATS